jgi:hypothetical protein
MAAWGVGRWASIDPADAAGMAIVYRERIGDDRLRAVVEHVRRWLMGNR